MSATHLGFINLKDALCEGNNSDLLKNLDVGNTDNNLYLSKIYNNKSLHNILLCKLNML